MPEKWYYAKDDWRGRRVTVMGLGRFGGGLGVTRWLVAQGAQVTVSDQAGEQDLAGSVAQLKGINVQLHLGGHLVADLTRCDLLVVNPAVPFDSPHLKLARDAGVELTTEINLFVARCRAPILGITGSAGKSTAAAMTGAILAQARRTHVGGNIGGSLLEALPEIAPEHAVVLELSSFQLSYFPLLRRSPGVAVVTNLRPNHLDRHKDMAEYADAKRNIFRYQGPDGVLVLNRQDSALADWPAQAPGRVEFFSADDEPFRLKLPGRHNQANAQAAWTGAKQLGASRAAAQEALTGFAGLPHRLQLVAERNGVRFFDDSKCTSPDEALVALESFPPRSFVIIVGGYDKKIELAGLCAALARCARVVVATGQTGPTIARGVQAARGEASEPEVVLEPDFAPAVRAAQARARRGEAVLLSPACASFDQFNNYEQRGQVFVELVSKRK